MLQEWFCREEFYHLKASFYCLRNLRRCDAAWENRNFFFQTVIYDLRIKSRAYNELRTSCNSCIHLLSGKNSSCSYKHLRKLLCHQTD